MLIYASQGTFLIDCLNAPRLINPPLNRKREERIVDDNQVANELIERGIIGAEEAENIPIGQILINRGIIAPEELRQGMSIFQILRGRGII